MRCVFDLERISEEERTDWDDYTNNQPFPFIHEMDIECVPIKGDDVNISFTFDNGIVEITGTIINRILCDERKDEIQSPRRDIYYWLSVGEIEVYPR